MTERSSTRRKIARLRVAGLWFRGDRSDLDVAEAEARQTTPAVAVLVVAGGEPDPVGKAQTEDLDRLGIGHRELRSDNGPKTGHPPNPGNRLERQPVRRLGIEAEEQRARQWGKANSSHQSPSIIRIFRGIGDGR